MKRSNCFLYALVAAVLIVQPCFAADNNYVVVKSGIYSPQARSMRHFDTGFSGEVAFGHRVNENIAFEGGLGYFNTKRSLLRTTSGIFREKDSMDIVPITLSLKVIRPAGKWDIFGMGGIGAYIISEDVKVNGSVAGWSGKASFDDTSTTYGVHLGAGLHYNISSSLFVGAEGKYVWVKPVSLRDRTADVPIYMDARHKIDGVQATAVIGVKF